MTMHLLDQPFLVFAISVVVLWVAAWAGTYIHLRGTKETPKEAHDDIGVVLAAGLTLLGLIIGFSFSMATSRYDLRKGYEETEANAIGTEYLRADLLPASDGAQIRALLRQYTELRIRFYEERDGAALRQVREQTEQLQNRLWAAVSGPANVQPNATRTLVASGMNDVINSEGYTQASWLNRIPTSAWGMMAAIAIFCNALFGYSVHRAAARLFAVLPILVAISFLLIADIDSPRGGIIRVYPENLQSLNNSFHAQ